MTSLQPPVLTPSSSCGGRLVATCGRTLPLRSTRLVVRCAGGIAAVQVVQTFANPFAEALQLRYLLPLPADAAVAGFAFVVGDRRVTGEIDRRAAARERFERALVEGRTAGLLEQERSALFSQELGNVPPGVEVTAEITLDQPLSWVEGQWEWRFPTTVAPRYAGADGRVGDAARVEVPVADAPIPPRLQLDLLVKDALAAGALPASPSHNLSCAPTLTGVAVQFAGAPMDRDVVVRWPVAAQRTGVVLQCARPVADAPHADEAYGMVTLVPPVRAGQRALPRDVIVLLDVSGSMAGQPLAAAQRVVGELIGSLGSADRLELIAFASRPQPWLGEPCFATEANKAAALRWLMGLQANGGTEMRDGILAALRPLRADAQRQIVLVTDGGISFEAEIVREIRTRLPAASRVHVVGVGSAPNRSLTRPAARAGRGLEVLIGLDEDPAPAARALLARTAMPLVAELQVSGTALLGVCPEALPDLFGGAPVRLGVRLRPAGGTLLLRGVTAGEPFTYELHVAPIAAGSGDGVVVRLVGREQVEDLETELAARGDRESLNARIEQIGLHFGLATRATSWVAIDREVGVDPRAPRRVVEVPQELPYGMSVEGLGLRGAAPMAAGAAMSCLMSAPIARGRMPAEQDLADEMESAFASPAPRLGAPKARRGFFDRLFSRDQESPGQPPPPRAEAPPPAAHAVLRVRTATEWVFDLFGLEQWSLPERIVLVFADGREFVVTVAAERSTRAGVVATGVAVRLVTAALADLPATRPILMRLGDGPDARILVIT